MTKKPGKPLTPSIPKRWMLIITGGILGRDCAISKHYLAVVYATIGGALLQASFHYYLSFLGLQGND